MKKAVVLLIFLLLVIGVIFGNGCKKEKPKTMDEEASDLEKEIGNLFNETENLSLDIEINESLDDLESLL